MDALKPTYKEARTAEAGASHAQDHAVTTSIASGRRLLPYQRAKPGDHRFWEEAGASQEVVAAARARRPAARNLKRQAARKIGRPPDPFRVLLRLKDMNISVARRDMQRYVILERVEGVRAALDGAGLDPRRFVDHATYLVSLDPKKDLVDKEEVLRVLSEYLA